MDLPEILIFFNTYWTLITAIFGFVASFVVGKLWPRIVSIFRNRFDQYPVKVRSMTIDEIFDSIRYAAKQVRRHSAGDPPIIIGLNRGGAIFGGLIAKQLDQQKGNIGLVNYSGDNPNLILPEHLKIRIQENNSRIVVVDDQFGSGVTSNEGIKVIKEVLGDDIKILFYVIKSARDPHKPPVGNSPPMLNDLDVVVGGVNALFITSGNLPWDEH